MSYDVKRDSIMALCQGQTITGFLWDYVPYGEDNESPVIVGVELSNGVVLKFKNAGGLNVVAHLSTKSEP